MPGFRLRATVQRQAARTLCTCRCGSCRRIQRHWVAKTHSRRRCYRAPNPGSPRRPAPRYRHSPPGLEPRRQSRDRQTGCCSWVTSNCARPPELRAGTADSEPECRGQTETQSPRSAIRCLVPLSSVRTKHSSSSGLRQAESWGRRWCRCSYRRP